MGETPKILNEKYINIGQKYLIRGKKIQIHCWQVKTVLMCLKTMSAACFTSGIKTELHITIDTSRFLSHRNLRILRAWPWLMQVSQPSSRPTYSLANGEYGFPQQNMTTAVKAGGGGWVTWHVRTHTNAETLTHSPTNTHKWPCVAWL